MRLPPLLFLALGLAAAAVAADAPPGSAAAPSTSRLAEAYRGAKDPDARFWIVDALHRRLLEAKDERALQALLEACRDAQADVRRQALSSLEGWRALPEEARARWKDRVAEEAARASRDAQPRVRAAAAELSSILQSRAPLPAPASEPVPEPAESPRLALGLAVWAVSVPLAAWLWAALGLSLLRQSGESGRELLRRVAEAASRPDYLLFPCVSALLAIAVCAGGLGMAIARGLAPGAPPLTVLGSLRYALAVYVAWGLALFVPAALLARRAARRAPAGGAFAAALSSLRDLPGSLALGAVVVAAWPAEALRFALARKPAETPWRWMAAVGAPFAGCWTAAIGARRRVGWLEALTLPERPEPPAAASWLARPLGHAPLLLWYAAAPSIFALALVPARWARAEPSALMDLWFVSSPTFAAAFAVWAGAMAVSAFLGLCVGAAALSAAESALAAPEAGR